MKNQDQRTKVQVRRRKDSNPKGRDAVSSLSWQKIRAARRTFQLWETFTENNSLKNTFSSKLPPLLHMPLKVPKNATNHPFFTALKKSLLDL